MREREGDSVIGAIFCSNLGPSHVSCLPYTEEYSSASAVADHRPKLRCCQSLLGHVRTNYIFMIQLYSLLPTPTPLQIRNR